MKGKDDKRESKRIQKVIPLFFPVFPQEKENLSFKEKVTQKGAEKLVLTSSLLGSSIYLLEPAKFKTMLVSRSETSLEVTALLVSSLV